jgi:hypothetical protein
MPIRKVKLATHLGVALVTEFGLFLLEQTRRG